MPQVGEPVPDFTLTSTAGTLTPDCIGVWRDQRVVLAFYVEDHTPG